MKLRGVLFVAMLHCSGAAVLAQIPVESVTELSAELPVSISPAPDVRVLAPAPTSNVVLGTWKLNPEKSNYGPAQPPRSSVRQFIALPDGFIVSTISGISAQGIPTFTMSAARYDGRNYPLYNQVSLANFMMKGTKTPATQAYKVIDDHTVEITNRENGKVTTVLRRTISADRRTMTVVTKGTNAQGQAVDSVEVFEKQ